MSCKGCEGALRQKQVGRVNPEKGRAAGAAGYVCQGLDAAPGGGGMGWDRAPGPRGPAVGH